MEIIQGEVQPFKSLLMVWRQERVEHWLWGEEESLWHVKEVKYLGDLFISPEKVEREIDRQTGAQSPVVRKPYWADVVHRHNNQKAFTSMVTGDQETEVSEVFRVEALLLRAPAYARCEILSPISCVILLKQKKAANHSLWFCPCISVIYHFIITPTEKRRTQPFYQIW